MKSRLKFLLLFGCLNLLIPRVWSALAGKSSDRIFDYDHIGEACDLAERLQVPLCLCVLDIVPRESQLEGLETYWKESLTTLSESCVVIVSDHQNPSLFHLANLQLRTKAASKGLLFTGIKLVDPWQEKLLATAEVSPYGWEIPDTRRKLLPAFKEQMTHLLKSAKEWNSGNVRKPETWTDLTNRPLTATALGCDGKTGRFKLANGKSVTLPVATLSESSRTRLLALFPPPLPILDADDPEALQKHLGQEVIVLSRKPEFRDSRSIERSATGDPRNIIFSYLGPLVGYRIEPVMADKFRQANADSTFDEFHITRMKGILQKASDPKATYQFFINIEDPRQLGPGIPRK